MMIHDIIKTEPVPGEFSRDVVWLIYLTMTNVALIDMCCFEEKILISIVNSEDNRMWVTFDVLLPIQ